MIPNETLIIENPVDLNSIMLVLAFLCVYIVIYFIISIVLDRKRLQKYKKIKSLIEDGHQKRAFDH